MLEEMLIHNRCLKSLNLAAVSLGPEARGGPCELSDRGLKNPSLSFGWLSRFFCLGLYGLNNFSGEVFKLLEGSRRQLRITSIMALMAVSKN